MTKAAAIKAKIDHTLAAVEEETEKPGLGIIK
jgi:hypothetical protein